MNCGVSQARKATVSRLSVSDEHGTLPSSTAVTTLAGSTRLLTIK